MRLKCGHYGSDDLGYDGEKCPAGCTTGRHVDPYVAVQDKDYDRLADNDEYARSKRRAWPHGGIPAAQAGRYTQEATDRFEAIKAQHQVGQDESER